MVVVVAGVAVIVVIVVVVPVLCLRDVLDAAEQLGEVFQKCVGRLMRDASHVARLNPHSAIGEDTHGHLPFT